MGGPTRCRSRAWLHLDVVPRKFQVLVFTYNTYTAGHRRLNSKTNPRFLLLVLAKPFFTASNSSASDCTIVLTVPQVNAISRYVVCAVQMFNCSDSRLISQIYRKVFGIFGICDDWRELVKLVYWVFLGTNGFRWLKGWVWSLMPCDRSTGIWEVGVYDFCMQTPINHKKSKLGMFCELTMLDMD